MSSFGTLQVPPAGVLCGWEGATQNLEQGGRLVGGGHLLPEPIWTEGTGALVAVKLQLTLPYNGLPGLICFVSVL